MARPGVTYQDVANAATEVIGSGKNPTVENIRGILGTGSLSTINNHLKHWKATQQGNRILASKENLPEELVALIKGLWEQVLHAANEKVINLQAQYEEANISLTMDLEKFKKNNQRWQQLYHQWLQEKQELAKEKSMLAEGIQTLEKNLTSLQAKLEIQAEQLKEKKVHIDEMQRLHKQAQENLEHYREAVREQRLVDQENFEQQKQELHKQLCHHEQQAQVLENKMLEISEQRHALQQKYMTLEEINRQLVSQLEHTNKALKTAEKSSLEHAKMETHWHLEFKKISQELENLRLEVTNLHMHMGLAEDKNNQYKQQIEEIQAENKLLIQDKWILVQEKAQLAGQLKQLQQQIQREFVE